MDHGEQLQAENAEPSAKNAEVEARAAVLESGLEKLQRVPVRNCGNASKGLSSDTSTGHLLRRLSVRTGFLVGPGPDAVLSVAPVLAASWITARSRGPGMLVRPRTVLGPRRGPRHRLPPSVLRLRSPRP